MLCRILIPTMYVEEFSPSKNKYCDPYPSLLTKIRFSFQTSGLLLERLQGECFFNFFIFLTLLTTSNVLVEEGFSDYHIHTQKLGSMLAGISRTTLVRRRRFIGLMQKSMKRY